MQIRRDLPLFVSYFAFRWKVSNRPSYFIKEIQNLESKMYLSFSTNSCLNKFQTQGYPSITQIQTRISDLFYRPISNTKPCADKTNRMIGAN